MKGGSLNSFKILIIIYLLLTSYLIYKIYQYGFVGYIKRKMEKRQRRTDRLKGLFVQS
jgi:hypothetical protein